MAAAMQSVPSSFVMTLLQIGASALVVSTARADQTQTETTFEGWRVFSASDAMTDNKWFGASISSTDGKASLQIECETAKPLGLSFTTTKFLGSGIRDLAYRVDKLPAHNARAIYTKNTASLLCDGKCSGQTQAAANQSLMDAMVQGQALLVRFRTYDQDDYDTSFLLGGFQDAKARLFSICKPTIAPPSSVVSAVTTLPVPPTPAGSSIGNDGFGGATSSGSSSLEQTLERLRSLQSQGPRSLLNSNPSLGGVGKTAGSVDTNDAKLSVADVSAIVGRIRQCWTNDPVSAAGMPTTLRLTTDVFGVVRLAEIVQASQKPGGSVLAEQARRATLDPQCNPLPLPKTLLGRNQSLVLTLKP